MHKPGKHHARNYETLEATQGPRLLGIRKSPLRWLTLEHPKHSDFTLALTVYGASEVVRRHHW